MATVEIFISYRRDSDATRAALVAKSIEGSFAGDDTRNLGIFRDVRQRLGVEWPDETRRRLEECHIVVAVIGPEWLAAHDRYFKRRIDEEDDWVRQELRGAIELEKLLIPVLFDGAEMPPPRELPAAIAALADRQGLPVRTDNLEDDLQPLLEEIRRQADSLADRDVMASPHGTATGSWPYPDPPLPTKPAQMADQDIVTAMEQLIPYWAVAESPLPQDESKKRVELTREFRFASFRQTLDFMSEVGDFCDRLNHHPRWENVYHTLWVYLTTWDIGHRISHIDILLASHMSKVYDRYSGG